MKQDGHVSGSCSARSATGKRAGGAGGGAGATHKQLDISGHITGETKVGSLLIRSVICSSFNINFPGLLCQTLG